MSHESWIFIQAPASTNQPSLTNMVWVFVCPSPESMGYSFLAVWTKEVWNVMQDEDFCNANPRDQVREALSRTLAYKLSESSI